MPPNIAQGRCTQADTEGSSFDILLGLESVSISEPVR